MTENPVKKRPHKLSYIALASAIVLVCLLLLNWLIRASSTITSDFTKDMNMIYLREMTDLTQTNFNSSLSLRYSGLKAVAESVNGEDMKNLETIERFITDAEANNDFDFMAFIDEDGYYYSRDGKRPAASHLSFLAELLKGGDRLISYNEAFHDNDMIVLGTQISPIIYDGRKINGA